MPSVQFGGRVRSEARYLVLYGKVQHYVLEVQYSCLGFPSILCCRVTSQYSMGVCTKDTTPIVEGDIRWGERGILYNYCASLASRLPVNDPEHLAFEYVVAAG